MKPPILKIYAFIATCALVVTMLAQKAAEKRGNEAAKALAVAEEAIQKLNEDNFRMEQFGLHISDPSKPLWMLLEPLAKEASLREDHYAAASIVFMQSAFAKNEQKRMAIAMEVVMRQVLGMTNKP